MRNKNFIKSRNTIRTIIFTILFIGGQFGLSSATLQQEEQQEFIEYKGVVVDSNTKGPLGFADINISETNIRTITNSEGEFSIKISPNQKEHNLIISFLGYEKKSIPLKRLKSKKNEIQLDILVTQLTEIDLSAVSNAEALVKETLKRKESNYYNNHAIMTAFYRETIKKRNKNASLSEAVVEIYKQPYISSKKDVVTLVKARKQTNYARLDTLTLKLQGGPFSTLYADLMKYSQFIFSEKDLSEYDFTFAPSTQINERKVYVVNFKQKPEITYPLYYGKLYIDAETYSLTSAIYNLNVENRKIASDMFIRKKPNRAEVYPTNAAYRVDYRTKNGKWYYGYSNIQLTFKVNWKGKLFNSTYTLNSEMAITDWEQNNTGITKPKNRLKSNVILTDQASGFSDPKFWGTYNIIEPEKSIESAIKKINKQLNKASI